MRVQALDGALDPMVATIGSAHKGELGDAVIGPGSEHGLSILQKCQKRSQTAMGCLTHRTDDEPHCIGAMGFEALPLSHARAIPESDRSESIRADDRVVTELISLNPTYDKKVAHGSTATPQTIVFLLPPLFPPLP